MDGNLKTAAETGNIDELYECIRTNGNVLKDIDEMEFVDTPLHIAAAAGRMEFCKEMMNLKPSFAKKLNPDGLSPLHLALRLKRGRRKMATCLVNMDNNLVRVKGKEGYTPLHDAVQKLDVDDQQLEPDIELLAEFLKECPLSVQDLTIRNQTALHVATNGAFEVLAYWIFRTSYLSKEQKGEILSKRDLQNNYTALHVAVNNNQRSDVINLLLKCKVDKNVVDSYDRTALDIFQARKVDKNQVNLEGATASLDSHIHDKEDTDKKEKILLQARCLSADKITKPKPSTFQDLIVLKPGKGICCLERLFIEWRNDLRNTSLERSNALLVVLVLILTATYQATFSPPGGVGGGNDSFSANKTTTTSALTLNNTLTQRSQVEGTSVMGTKSFLFFFIPNNLALFTTYFLTMKLLFLLSSGRLTYMVLMVPLSTLLVCLLGSMLVISPSGLCTYIVVPIWVTCLCLTFFFLLLPDRMHRTFLVKMKELLPQIPG